MVTHLWRSALRRPAATILAAVSLTLAAGSGLARLELRTDGQALVPHRSPEVRFDRQIRSTFDIEDRLAVVVESEHPQGIFNLGTLRLVADLTARLAAIEGIDPEEITSLATERSRRRRGGGPLEFSTWLEPFPKTAQEVEELRSDLAEMPIYSGTLLSRGLGPPAATAILIGLDATGDRSLIYRRVVDIVASEDGRPERIHVVGPIVAETLLGQHILADLIRLVPVSILLMSLIFYFRYRSLAAVLLPITEVAACMIFVFGVMGHAGVPVTLAMTILPVILTAIGVADEVHIFDRYSQILRPEMQACDHPDAVAQTMHEMWRPVVKTSLTTSLAFLSFTFSPLAPVGQFGIFTALGVLFCMLWSLTVIPACLGLISKAAFSVGQASGWPHRFGQLEKGVRRFRWAISAAAVLAALLLPLGLRRLVVQDSWLDGFPTQSAFWQSTQRINQLFCGTHVLLVCFDSRPGALLGELHPLSASKEVTVEVPQRLQMRLPAPPGLDPAQLIGEQMVIRAVPLRESGESSSSKLRGQMAAEIVIAEPQGNDIRIEVALQLDSARRRFLTSFSNRRWRFAATGERLLDPRLLEQLRRTVAFLETRLGGSGGVLGLPAQLATVRNLLWGGKDEDLQATGTPLRNRYLLSILSQIRGARREEEIIDAARQQTLITVFLKSPDFVSVKRLMSEIRQYAQAELEPAGIRIGFAGDVAVSQSMIGAIVSTQTRSLVFSLLAILLAAALLSRSLWLGLLCLLPPLLAVLIDFSLMGWLGVPLGVATSMMAAMTLGIGVDFAIHLTERLRHPVSGSTSWRNGLKKALSVTGPAISMNGLVIVAGFSVMMLSQVPSNARLGLLIVASIITCWIASLILVPLLLALRPIQKGNA